MNGCPADQHAGSAGSWIRLQRPTPAGSSRRSACRPSPNGCPRPSPSTNSWNRPRTRPPCSATPTSAPNTSGGRPQRTYQTAPSTTGCATSCSSLPPAAVAVRTGRAGSAACGGPAARARQRAAGASGSWTPRNAGRSSGLVTTSARPQIPSRPTRGSLARPSSHRCGPRWRCHTAVSSRNSLPLAWLFAFRNRELSNFQV